ncbi:hypothetical protein DFH08DRAFT_1085289 [Mycena albidolilacea]|uniref:RRM domain-containing protein n=1 Tax=Mycena albidolilacea TaxID=1033008 RepID=A0AAD6ZIU7_9AGAR|nr:hypothetical protein DFH08DRAFT_1085289 [Mycena albidolilacea]
MSRRFKTIAAAEECILTLKRSDLHPSFSKVNKPLLIVCPNSPFFPSRSASSFLGSDQDIPLPRSPDLNFKAKIAQLEDKNSANVFIEGLPLSADKNTLMELVYPYVIQSTRFLRSKFPGSQTMIVFMRMATHAVAEDVILGDENKVYLRIADCGHPRSEGVECVYNCLILVLALTSFSGGLDVGVRPS